MNKNVGTADRVFRVVAGLVLLSLLFLLDGEAKWFGLIGIVPLATAAMSWCPLYTLFGIRTCPANRR
ncbi:YgaP family membrane protein [Zavarzinia aquatilis]|uniref:DUF2892 domain-containing protein n=1 Tax=Zavarzinia aquatilis TaxID=2211142 RepID=A0A317ED23_9PROT|nr:DUF2892 domain-containing protein [Zavarzinia aquatilis]PWR24928.1 DUF2892 domain-containing protein [Zavarzinia aquatilis]